MPATWIINDVQNLFGEFGFVENTTISRGSEEDRALVEFKDFSDAELAKKHLNNCIINGKNLSVENYD
jgi:RNA recognition motif-containing protein